MMKIPDDPKQLFSWFRRNPLITTVSICMTLVITLLTMWGTGFLGELGRQSAVHLGGDQVEQQDALKKNADAEDLCDPSNLLSNERFTEEWLTERANEIGSIGGFQNWLSFQPCVVSLPSVSVAPSFPTPPTHCYRISLPGAERRPGLVYVDGIRSSDEVCMGFRVASSGRIVVELR